jgi:hypothetical protein
MKVEANAWPYCRCMFTITDDYMYLLLMCGIEKGALRNSCQSLRNLVYNELNDVLPHNDNYSLILSTGKTIAYNFVHSKNNYHNRSSRKYYFVDWSKEYSLYMYTIVLQEILVDRAVHAAASCFVLPPNASLNSVRKSLVMEDFVKATHGFLPVAMRDLRKYAPDDKDGGWEDVGGLNEAVTIIKEVHTSYFLVLSACLYGN